MLGVLLAQDGLFCRNVPVNAQRIIQNADTSVRFRMIEVVTLVLEDGRFHSIRQNRGRNLLAQRTGDGCPQ